MCGVRACASVPELGEQTAVPSGHEVAEDAGDAGAGGGVEGGAEGTDVDAVTISAEVLA